MAKDLDFDELDKAVTSLMGGVKEKDLEAPEKNLDINTTLGPNESPTYTHLGQVAETIGSETIDKHEQTVSLADNDKPEDPPAAPPPIKRNSGRFMDVVHPSSDMRQNSSKKVSREGVAIAAPDSDNAEPQATTAGNLPPTSADTVIPADEPEEESGDEAKKDVEPTPEPVKAPTEPLSSPFLPDAKVEKRPLGGNEPKKDEPDTPEPEEEPVVDIPAAPEEPTKHDTPESEESSKKDDEFSKMDAMAEPAQNLGEVNEHIPEEYKDELLAVEKNLAIGGEGQSSTLVAPVIASIPKQYQEKPSTGDSSNGAIFDTDQYHKPLAHPPKEKSGWTWVVVIVILILVGAGLGAAAYFFGLV